MAIIVIADDEFLLTDMLAMLLEDEGHDVATATDGLSALEVIHEKQPALLITDFMMPRMTGLELAEALRADARFSTLPIILVSGAQGGIARTHTDLFNAVLDKPYDLDKLLALIRHFL